MKKLKYSKKILLETQSFLKNIEIYYSKLNKEYAKNMIKLLENIADGEKLDLEMLKSKYLNTLTNEKKSSKKASITIFSNDNSSELNLEELNLEELNLEELNSKELNSEELNSEEINSKELNLKELNSEEIILDKIIINNINYYYENKENGNIYDSSSNIVGEYKNKIHHIFM
jgi:hypothetical protein